MLGTIAKMYDVEPEKCEPLTQDCEEKHYPCIYLDSETLPPIKEWEVDGEYTIILKVKQRSKSMHTEKKSEVYEASFEVHEAGVMAPPLKEEKQPEPKKVTLNTMYGV